MPSFSPFNTPSSRDEPQSYLRYYLAIYDVRPASRAMAPIAKTSDKELRVQAILGLTLQCLNEDSQSTDQKLQLLQSSSKNPSCQKHLRHLSPETFASILTKQPRFMSRLRRSRVSIWTGRAPSSGT